MPDLWYPVSGGTGRGYLAVPAGDGPWPGVLVIHEAFGLNADIRKHADRLAAAGYLAFAPDLLGGKPWMRCVLGTFRQLKAQSGPAFSVIDAARSWLAARGDCAGRTGVIGFCVGGAFALLCAPRGGFSVASVNYGVVPRDAESVLAGSCPIVASYGARDLMGTKHPERLERALVVREVPHDVKLYRWAGHRFMSETTGLATPLARIARLAYDEDAAADSWRRILAFFGEHLPA